VLPILQADFPVHTVGAAEKAGRKQMKKTFRLYANCLPVCGARRSVICDVQRQRYSFIPNQLYKILMDLQGRTVDEIKAVYGYSHDSVIDSYFEFLLSNGYGFYSDDPAAFPALDLSWDHPAVITNAIVDVDAGSSHDYAALFKELHAFRCYLFNSEYLHRSQWRIYAKSWKRPMRRACGR